MGTRLSPTLGTPAIEYVSGTSQKIRTPTAFGFYKVKVIVSSIASEAFESIQHQHAPSAIHAGVTSITVLVPGPVLQNRMPAITREFDSSHTHLIERDFLDRVESSPPYSLVCGNSQDL